MIKTLCLIYAVTMLALVFVWLGASPNEPTKECVEWQTVYPTPTPVPMAAIYTEWIPFPGKAPDTGYGWIQATDFIKAQKEWPPKNLQVHILTDEESNNIKQSIQNFNVFMEKVPSISTEIDAMLSDVSSIVDNINSGEGTLAKLINREDLYDNINGLVLDARSLLDDVKQNPAKYLRAWFEAKKK